MVSLLHVPFLDGWLNARSSNSACKLLFKIFKIILAYGGL